MNPFANRINNQSWVVPVSAMCLVLGFMISLAWVTQETRSSRLGLLGPDQSKRITEATTDVEGYEQISAEVAKLREEKTKLENAMATTNGQSKVLNENLQEVKMFAGLTDTEGPGVMVTLRDVKDDMSTNSLPNDATLETIIHDTDVLQVVNELFSSGAEAISVNDHRITDRSSIRCAGPTILVNDNKIASPIIIRAIGDPDTLYGGINLRGGALSQIRAVDMDMVSVEKIKKMTVHAFVGTTAFKYAKVPKVDNKK